MKILLFVQAGRPAVFLQGEYGFIRHMGAANCLFLDRHVEACKNRYEMGYRAGQDFRVISDKNKRD